MKMTYVYIALVVLLAGGIYFVKQNTENAGPTPERLTRFDVFAQCLSDAGAKFYGAYWCSHCQEQKKLFQNSKKLPYIECSTPNGQAQTQVCIDAGIKGYPTWEFKDGSRLDKVVPLDELGVKTGCELPAT